MPRRQRADSSPPPGLSASGGRGGAAPRTLTPPSAPLAAPPAPTPVAPLHGVSVSVPYAVFQYTRSEQTVSYAVNVDAGGRGAAQVMRARFSDFERLHRSLCEGSMLGALAPRLAGLPELPARAGIFSVGTNTSFGAVEERRARLQTYLRRLVAVAYGTPLAARVDAFLLPQKDGPGGPTQHQGQTVVRTRWLCPVPAKLCDAGPCRVELPWARMCGDGEHEVDMVKGEKVSLVRRRFREFAAFLTWLSDHGDTVSGPKEAIGFLQKWRQRNEVPAENALPRGHAAGTPPARPQYIRTAEEQAPFHEIRAASAPQYTQPGLNAAAAAYHAASLQPQVMIEVTPPEDGDRPGWGNRRLRQSARELRTRDAAAADGEPELRVVLAERTFAGPPAKPADIAAAEAKLPYRSSPIAIPGLGCGPVGVRG